MARQGSRVAALVKGTNCFSSLGLRLRLGFHSKSRSTSPCNLESNNCRYELEKKSESNVTDIDDLLHTWVDKFNHLLDAVTNMKHYSYTIHLFKQICAMGVPVDECSMSIAIKCYCHLYHTNHGFTVLGYFLKRGILPNISTFNILLDGFILEDKTHEAEKLFKNIFKKKHVCEPDIVTYNTLIKGLCKVGNNFTAIGLIKLMDVVKPDLVTYNTIIHSLCNDLLIDDAFLLFKQMVLQKAIHPNVDTYNSFISSLCKLRHGDDVSDILKQMRDENISLDVATFNILVDVFSKTGNIKKAEFVFDIMVRSGNYPDTITYNSLILCYCMSTKLDKASSIFDSMGVQRNIDTYNTMLDGFLKLFYFEKAFYLYDQLINKEAKLKPNMTTYSIMNKALDCPLFPPGMTDCFKHVRKPFTLEEALSSLHFGDFIDYISENDNFYYKEVMSGASKCGRLDITRRLFNDDCLKCTEPDIWRCQLMISGLCQVGLLKEAKQLFFKVDNSCSRKEKDVMINHLITGYVKNKPFDDVCMFFQLLKGRIYFVSESTESLMANQGVSEGTSNRWSELIHGLPKQDVLSKYNEDEDEDVDVDEDEEHHEDESEDLYEERDEYVNLYGYNPYLHKDYPW